MRLDVRKGRTFRVSNRIIALRADFLGKVQAHDCWPIAAAMIECSVQSETGRTCTTRPRHITAMVSHTPSNSGRYELTKTTDFPAAASSPINSYICALLATSI